MRGNQNDERSVRKWAQREIQRRLTAEDPHRIEKLNSVEDFPHGYSWFESMDGRSMRRENGEESAVLRALIAQSCCGWPEPPTAAEAETTIKRRVCEGRAYAISGLIIREAPLWMIIEGEREQAWSLQDLAWWLHRRRMGTATLIRWMNVISREYVSRRRKNAASGVQCPER